MWWSDRKLVGGLLLLARVEEDGHNRGFRGGRNVPLHRSRWTCFIDVHLLQAPIPSMLPRDATNKDRGDVDARATGGKF